MATGYPSVIKNTSDLSLSPFNQNQRDFHKIRTGIPQSQFSLTWTKAQVDSGPQRVTFINPVFPFAVYLQAIQITSTRKITANYVLIPEIANGPQYFNYIELIPNVTYTVPVNLILRNSTSFSVYLRTWLDSDTTDSVVSIEPIGYTFTDEPILNATVPACIISNSINSGTSATRIENMFNTLLKNELRKRGVSISIPYNKSVSGSLTSTHLPYFRNQGYTIPDCRLYILELAENDSAIGGFSKAVHKANMNEIVDILLAAESKPLILLEAPTPNENDTTEALNVQYRTAVAEIVSERSATGRVFGIDLATQTGSYVFDRKVTTNFMGTDTAGSRIHPSDAGNLAIFTNAIVPYLNSAPGQAFITALKGFV